MGLKGDRVYSALLWGRPRMMDGCWKRPIWNDYRVKHVVLRPCVPNLKRFKLFQVMFLRQPSFCILIPVSAWNWHERIVSGNIWVSSLIWARMWVQMWSCTLRGGRTDRLNSKYLTLLVLIRQLWCHVSFCLLTTYLLVCRFIGQVMEILKHENYSLNE